MLEANLLREQRAALAEIEAHIAEGEKEIASISPDYKREAIQARQKEIRERVTDRVNEARSKMIERAEQAEVELPSYDQEARRRRAKFSDDPATDASIRLAVLTELTLVPSILLLERLRDAIREKNLAKAEAIRLIVDSRQDRGSLPREVGPMLKKLDDPAIDRGAKALKEVVGLNEFAKVRALEFSTGIGRPADRLAAARTAGLSRGQTQPA